MVSGKLLVGALPIKHYLDASTFGCVEYAPLGEDRSRAKWFLLMPYDVRGMRKDILRSWENIVWDRISLFYHSLYKRSFIDALLSVACRDSIDVRSPLVRHVEHPRHQTHYR